VADDSAMNATDVIATDHVTNLNGATVAQSATSPKVQRVKVAYGDDNSSRDVSPSFPLPVGTNDLITTGTVTAQDAASTTATSNPIPSRTEYVQTRFTGTPTANSAVRLDVTGESSFSFDVSGTFTGTLQIERTVDGVTWTAVAAFIAGSAYTTTQVTAPSAGHGNTSAAVAMRMRAISAWTGTATVTIRAGEGTGTITVGSPMRIYEPLSPTATVGTANSNIFNARTAVTTATTSVLVAAPAAGLSIYITDVSVSNAGSTLCTVSLLPSAGTSVLDITAAATGGGGSMNFGTPLKLAAATGLSVTTSAASTTVFVTVTGYYAP
jgi:hypothetical protein